MAPSNWIPLDPSLVPYTETKDMRGSFAKYFAKDIGERTGISPPKEVFLSTSHKGTIRGMHYQKPPHSGQKLVIILEGEVLDVVVSLVSGPTFGRIHYFKLSADQKFLLHVPNGYAHGFQVLSDNASLLYITDHEFSTSADTGVRWDCLGIDWPLTPTFISHRDQNLDPFDPKQEYF